MAPLEKFDDAFIRLLDGVATRASARMIGLLAAGLYGGLGLALPLALNWSVGWLVFANLTGTMLAGLFLLAWLVVQVQASRRRNLLEWTTDLRRLNSDELEWLVGELFRREGWKVAETGRSDGPDGGIDLVVTRTKERRLIQCKAWSARKVGVDGVRAFAGTIAREGLPKGAGVFVTLSNFTAAARDEANQMGLTLLDSAGLYARVEKVRRPEPCPVCARPLLLDRSPHGWWFRCIAQGCSGKRDLGRDPAEAVDLLTQPPS